MGFSSEIGAVDPRPGPLLSEHRQRGPTVPPLHRCRYGTPPIPTQLLEDPQRLRAGRPTPGSPTAYDVGDLTWDKIAVSLPRLGEAPLPGAGRGPHSMRPWVRRGATEAMGTGARGGTECCALLPLLSCGCGCSGALQKKRNSELSYERS